MGEGGLRMKGGCNGAQLGGKGAAIPGVVSEGALRARLVTPSTGGSEHLQPDVLRAPCIAGEGWVQPPLLWAPAAASSGVGIVTAPAAADSHAHLHS